MSIQITVKQSIFKSNNDMLRWGKTQTFIQELQGIEDVQVNYINMYKATIDNKISILAVIQNVKGYFLYNYIGKLDYLIIPTKNNESGRLLVTSYKTLEEVNKEYIKLKQVREKDSKYTEISSLVSLNNINLLDINKSTNKEIKENKNKAKPLQKLNTTTVPIIQTTVDLSSNINSTTIQLRRASLNFCDAINNHNKFYIIELIEDKVQQMYIIKGTYGRVGSTGVAFEEKERDCYTAINKYESKLRSKKNKGYKEVLLATQNKGSELNQSLVDKKYVEINNIADRKITESKIDKEIQTLVLRLYEEANQVILQATRKTKTTTNIAPLGDLSLEGIQQARKILEEIGNYLLRYKVMPLDVQNTYSSNYYSIVPRVLPRNLRIDNSWLINNTIKLAEEQDLLKLYEDTLKCIKGFVSTNIDTKYKELNTDIVVITDSKELQKIQEYLLKSKGSNHNYNLRLEKAYSLNSKVDSVKTFDTTLGNIQWLYHGSRAANIMGILNRGLKLPQHIPGVEKTGAMFGDGIYFASNSTKSANYSFANYSQNKNRYNTAYLFVYEVALGKEYRTTDIIKKAPQGYNSVHALAGRRLYNDEFIVYTERQARPKYLLEVKKSYS